jgi:hypothetical protein
MELTEVEAPLEAAGCAGRSAALAPGASLGLCDSLRGRPEPGVRDGLSLGLRESLGCSPSAARPKEDGDGDGDGDGTKVMLTTAGGGGGGVGAGSLDGAKSS